jgi:hypothetical protein
VDGESGRRELLARETELRQEAGESGRRGRGESLVCACDSRLLCGSCLAVWSGVSGHTMRLCGCSNPHPSCPRSVRLS